MRQRNRKISMYLLFILVACITVGYAILSTNLSIVGTTSIKGATWNVHFANIQPVSGSVTPTDAADIIDDTTVNYAVTLDKPGDFYEFTVDIVNEGSMDAMIDSFTITPNLTAQQRKYMEYVVEYSNGATLENKNILNHSSSKTLKIRTAYKSDVEEEDLPTSNSSLTINFSVDYVQADDTAFEPVAPVGTGLVSIVSGDGTRPGDEVAIGDEHFYVMEYDPMYGVHLITKYNLLIGNQNTGTWTATPLASPTGRQDPTAIGRRTNAGGDYIFPFIGTIEFSSTAYWNDYDWDTEFGLVPAYDEELSHLTPYLTNYKNYIESLGVVVDGIKLPIYDTLVYDFGCSMDSSIGCKNAPSWVYSTSYWTGSAESTNNNIMYGVFSDGSLFHDNATIATVLGVRPVIVLSNDYYINSGA